MHLCMIQSERAHVCVCACVRQSVFPNWLTVSGWLSTAEPIEHLRDREKVREKEKNREILKKRCRYFGAIKHHWHIFHSSYFFLLNVPLFNFFFPSFHKAVFFSSGWWGFGWRRDREATMETKHITDMSIPDGALARQ